MKNVRRFGPNRQTICKAKIYFCKKYATGYNITSEHQSWNIVLLQESRAQHSMF